MPETLALCPGTFDPITHGHLEIIRRAMRLFDRVVVTVTVNVRKRPLFTADERVEMISREFADCPQVTVEVLDGLLATHARDRRATAIVRGLRAPSDFEYELQMAQMNRHLNPDLDTVFLATDADGSYVSSSLVKEVAMLGGDVSKLVPAAVHLALLAKLGGAAAAD